MADHSGMLTILVVLDLSSAFDTVAYDLLNAVWYYGVYHTEHLPQTELSQENRWEIIDKYVKGKGSKTQSPSSLIFV